MKAIEITQDQARLLDMLGKDRDVAAAKFDGAMLAVSSGHVPIQVDTELRLVYVHDLEEDDAPATE